MIGTLFSTPRPEPGHLLPALLGGLVLVVALPVFLVAGWNVAGWALAAVLYAAVHALNLLLSHARARAGNLAAMTALFRRPGGQHPGIAPATPGAIRDRDRR